MKGKIVFVNMSSRLAAAFVGQDQYIVFEFPTNCELKENDELENLADTFGFASCYRLSDNKNIKLNILSSAMSFAKAKLVVSPWQESYTDDVSVA
ncbi:hypothetical protein [Agarilytica rhodophyticola]|uniref:hypothetical protein n=1 Tax=Agarilytica rhodophyticola TaxID=1737490 RepID=UPI000B3477DD|nr:hypothetical protein [Agarilytica rhodophyticola]